MAVGEFSLRFLPIAFYWWILYANPIKILFGPLVDMVNIASEQRLKFARSCLTFGIPNLNQVNDTEINHLNEPKLRPLIQPLIP
jgi:hypothetical protein